MNTKVKAAKDFLSGKKEVWILNGNKEDVIVKLVQNQESGTKIYLA